jgi:hypothetical protein
VAIEHTSATQSPRPIAVRRVSVGAAAPPMQLAETQPKRADAVRPGLEPLWFCVPSKPGQNPWSKPHSFEPINHTQQCRQRRRPFAAPMHICTRIMLQSVSDSIFSQFVNGAILIACADGAFCPCFRHHMLEIPITQSNFRDCHDRRRHCD